MFDKTRLPLLCYGEFTGSWVSSQNLIAQLITSGSVKNRSDHSIKASFEYCQALLIGLFIPFLQLHFSLDEISCGKSVGEQNAVKYDNIIGRLPEPHYQYHYENLLGAV